MAARQDMADSERALQGWVSAALADAFGDVAEERVPDDWIRLIETRLDA